MKTEMLMPQMGESIAEATILKWHKSLGDKVEKDETILEISTDKVDSEIPSPASGILVEIIAKQGDTVPVKSVIAIIDSDSAAKPAKSEAPKAEKAAPKAAAPAPKSDPVPAPAVSAPATAPAAAPAAALTAEDEKFYSPLVRNIAEQHNLSGAELASIEGSGNQGRVTKADVLHYIETRSAGGAAAPRAAKPKDSAPAAPRIDYGPDGTRTEPFDNMRKRIAEHMVRSKATSPHVYSMAEVDVTGISKWRQQKQSAFLSREGFKLSFTPFFLEAVVKGLVQFPYINASVVGESIVLKKNVNLGCAVALGTTGLIVPVIKSADQLNFVGIARALNDLAGRARSKKLTPDETQGGTFTVTNPGIFGNTMGCPIISQPQLAILGIGAIKKRPVVVDDMIAIRDIVYLTLSYDHRVIDGSMSGQFLQFITNYLEKWDSSREL